MDALERLLQEFFEGHGDAARHKAIEADLHALKDKPQALEEARLYLEASASPYLQWFAASVLEDTVNRKWHTLPVPVREQLRAFVLIFLTKERATHARLEPFVATKLQQVLVTMGRQIGGWPQAYPTFMSDILSLSRSPSTYSTGLALLAMCGVTFMQEDLALPSARKTELQAAFTAQLPAVVDLLSSLLAHAHEPSAAPGDITVQRDLACCALRCLSTLVEWPAMAECLTPDLCANVFKVVQAAVRPGTEANTMLPCGLAAIAVMTELMNKRCLPPQLEAFILHVATQMCMVLESVCTLSQTSHGQGVDEELLLGLLEFLTVFLEQHLGRILSLSPSSFPFPAFCNLLANFTFGELPHARLLRRAFLPWATLLEHLTESTAGLKALEENQQLLSAVAMALMGKLLFATNGRALTELEEGEEEGERGRGGGRAEVSGSDAWTLQMLLEDDEVGGGEKGGEGGEGEGGMSEQQEVITEGVALLLSFARLPACSQDLATAVLSSLGTALQRLSSGGTEKETLVDAHTLLSLALVIVPCSPAECYWAAVRLVLSATQDMNVAQFYARGRTFSRLHCTAFMALKDLTRGFDNALAAAAAPTTTSPPLPDLEGVVTELVNVARGILSPLPSPYTSDSPLPPTLEPVTHQAASLLLALSQRLPPRQLRSYPVIAQLMKDAYHLVHNHPLPVQEKVLQAVSLLLHPNAGPRLADPEEERNLTAAYITFVSPLVTSLTTTHAQLQQASLAGGAGVVDPDLVMDLRKVARLLRSFCLLYAQTPKRIKSSLYAALRPALPSLLPCLDFCLQHLSLVAVLPTSHDATVGGTTGRTNGRNAKAAGYTATAAQALFGLLLALHACFGKELGPSFMTEAVQLFVRLDLAQCLDGRDKHGQQQQRQQRQQISVFLLSALLRLLRQISADRSSTPPGIVIPMSHLALDTLLPLVRAAPADLLPLLLRLLASLLSDHWKDFIPSSSSSSSSSSSINGPLGEILLRQKVGPTHPSKGGNGSSVGLATGIHSSSNEKKEFVSPEMETIFERVLLVIFEALQDTSLSPGTVRLAIELLQQLNRDVALFRLDYFRTHMRLPYALTVLQLLLARAHPSLRDELLALLGALTVGVPATAAAVGAGIDGEDGTTWTFDTLLPQVLIKTEGLSDEQRGQLLATVSRDIRDGPSFSKHMAAFVGDVSYAQMMHRGNVG